MKDIKKYFEAPLRAKASFLVMGSSQILQGQYIKGLLYLAVLALYVIFLVTGGAVDIKGFFTLGETTGDAWLGIEGDDSIMMMLKGIIAFAVTGLLIGLWLSNIRDAYNSELVLAKNGTLPDFVTAVKKFMDKKFYVVSLTLPVTGVVIFSILPIVFMILIAFTNYGGEIIPPA